MRETVRAGYDAVSWAYRGDDETPPGYAEWAEMLAAALPGDGGDVLDLGCGNGIPVARDLTAAGHRVTGVDLSGVQIERARTLVPHASFAEADMTTVTFPPSSFDAVVCLYALIHLPDEDQRAVLARVAGWLRPDATFLATVGTSALTGGDPDWLGSGAAMWWNHPDADVVRGWLDEAGLTVHTDRFVPDRYATRPDAGHRLLVATRR